MTKKKKILVVLLVIVVTLVLVFLGLFIYGQIWWHYQLKSLPERRPGRGSDETMYLVFIRGWIEPGMPYEDVVNMLGEPSRTGELLEDKLWCEFDACDMAGTPSRNPIIFDADKRVEFVPHLNPGSPYLQYMPPPGTYKLKKESQQHQQGVTQPANTADREGAAADL